MSMPSQQVHHLCLCVHWRGQKCSVSGAQGVIGVKPNGDVHHFHSSEIGYIQETWHVLIGFERAHGWLSVQCLKASDGICVNGHLLSSGPLLMKETTLMLPPHSNESIELFLCESLAEWEKVLSQDSQACVASLALGHAYPRYASKEAVTAKIMANQLEQSYDDDYGLVDKHGVFAALVAAYNFGALRFELLDDECWVCADDGILKVNDRRVVTSQVYVGDQIQWQGNHWLLAGRSELTRPFEVVRRVKKASVEQQASEDLFPVNDVETLQHVRATHAELEEELADFREKLSTWLDLSPRTNSFDGPDLYRPLPYRSERNPVESVSQMALLRLGRRSYAMRDYDADSNASVQQSAAQPAPELRSRYSALSSRHLMALLAAIAVGVIGGIVVMQLL